MTDRVQAIEMRLRRSLGPGTIEIRDDSAAHAGHPGASAGGHFSVVVVAAAFSGKNTLARHRMVYDALADLRGEIHALSIRTLAPDEI